MMAAPIREHSWSLRGLLDGWAQVSLIQDRPVGGLTLDSRRVAPGELFLACRGGSVHGLRYAEGAVLRGAGAVAYEPDPEWAEERLAALSRTLHVPLIPVDGLSARASALAARFFGDPSADLEVTGVTGTNGKTSVTHYLAQALGPSRACSLIGTLGYGSPGSLRPLTHTTPDPVTLQAILAGFRDDGSAAVAMEVSSHSLDQGRAESVHFSTAVFTNLSRDHLDYHQDMGAYAAAKRRLFLTPGLRHAVLNWDDETGRQMLGALSPDVAVGVYGLQDPGRRPPRAAVWAWGEQLELLPRGLRLEIHSSAGSGELEVGLLGAFNASNLLAVCATLLAQGLELPLILQRLAGLREVPGRMECFGGVGEPLVVVDYAHTPDALEQVMATLQRHAAGRLITVFGCGGERDRGKRPEMGRAAEQLSDQVILTDDNPRREDGAVILADILAGMREPHQAKVERNRAAAIRWALGEAGAEDVVLVAGKGHETSQQVGDLKVVFSDRAEVIAALSERRGEA